jgi:hypothetical protein
MRQCSCAQTRDGSEDRDRHKHEHNHEHKETGFPTGGLCGLGGWRRGVETEINWRGCEGVARSMVLAWISRGGCRDRR